MSYIDAYLNSDGKVYVSSRINGQRVIKTHDVDYHFYVYDENGKYKNIYGDRLKRLEFNTKHEFESAKNRYGQNVTHESDFSPVFRTLEQSYNNIKEEKPHVAFFDIETDFDKTHGYSSPEEARNPIISIAIYLAWSDTSICLAIPPETMSISDCVEIANTFKNDHVIMFETEAEMLNSFLDLIEDADALSGWNSGGYDIPYLIHRIQRVLGRKETHRLCLWQKFPKKRIVKQKTGKDSSREYTTYSLIGRTHLDYMEIYKNFTYEAKQSYKLDSIAEDELGKNKVEYEGKLHELYRNNFQKFIEYNIVDTMLLHELELRLRYLDLAFGIAWSNCVLPETVLGTVRLMEQAVTIEAHSRNMILPDVLKKRGPNKKTVGGWVFGNQGVHDWVGSIDLTSLYPSIIRSLNMSPETIVGQISNDHTYAEIDRWIGNSKAKSFTQWWSLGKGRYTTIEMDKVFEKSTEKIKVEFDIDDGYKKLPAKDIYNIIFDSDNLCVSANGTIFRTDQRGVIASLLTRWFDERVIMKGHKATIWKMLNEKYSIPDELISDIQKKSSPKSVSNVYEFRHDELNDVLESNDIDEISQFLNRWGISVSHDGTLNPINKEVWSTAEAYWDKQQLIKKILLNSLYGGLLNEHFRFYDQRIGQSVTLTGRSISKHMAAKANEVITGDFDNLGTACVYGDTDSVYLTIANQLDQDEIKKLSVEDFIEIYDQISFEVNESFTSFMMNTFNAHSEYAKAIRCDREVVGKRMYVVAKKMYSILVLDNEGDRKDVDGEDGYYKIAGLSIRRADTPPLVQDWLLTTLKVLLRGGDYKTIENMIHEYAKEYRSLSAWEMGAPKSANGITKYRDEQQKYLKNIMKGITMKKPSIPGHVLGSMNWNDCLETYHDLESERLVDGVRVKFCYLNKNDLNIDRICYPSDQLELPEWFRNLSFDTNDMFQKNFVKKFEGLFKKSDINMNFKAINNVSSDDQLKKLFSKK